MDSLNELTDELLCLPGFIRRNLLLIRDLDLKSAELFNEANKLSASVFGTDYNVNDYLKDKAHTDRSSISSTSDKHLNYSSEKTTNTTTETTTNTKDVDKKHPGSAKRKLKDENIFFENTKQFDDIQNLRMQGIYVLQEKIDVNNQISTMLRYEYENLRSKFDAIYTEMDLKGQIPHELKVYINSNKKKSLFSEASTPTPPGSTNVEKAAGGNQLDISVMFKNILESQNLQSNLNNLTSDNTGSSSQTKNVESSNDGDEENRYSEFGSKVVNRQVPGG